MGVYNHGFCDSLVMRRWKMNFKDLLQRNEIRAQWTRIYVGIFSEFISAYSL